VEISDNDASAGTAFKLKNKWVDVGPYRYHLESYQNGSPDAYNYRLFYDPTSSDNISNSARSLSNTAFQSLGLAQFIIKDPTGMRGIMDPGKAGFIRQHVDTGNQSATTEENKDWGVWSQGMLWRTRIDQPGGGMSFNTDSYMIQAGLDRTFHNTNGRTVFGGLFGYANSTAKPENTRSDTDIYFGGLYGSYFSDKG